MRNKKISLCSIILVVAVLGIAAFAVISNIAKKPTVTEGEFPFSITYELDGETVTIEDVYRVRYDRNAGYADTKSRIYVGEIGDMGEDNTIYTIREDENGRIELHTQFYAEYLMGECDSSEIFEPLVYYYDTEEQEYGDEETLEAQGVKIIGFEYPAPIENSLVFSHISYCNGEVVFPTELIAILALAAILIFVKKEKELQYKAIDKVSLILNIAVGVTLVPFVSIAAALIDINGGGPELYRQVLYFIPAFTVLCIAASVALRRKGRGLKSLIAVLVGPAAFVVYLVICGMCGLL